MKSLDTLVLTIMHIVFIILMFGLLNSTLMMIVFYVKSLYDSSSQGMPGLENLYHNNYVHYNILACLIIVIHFIQVAMSYHVVIIFRKLNLNQPFDIKISHHVQKIGKLALFVTLISILGLALTKWIMTFNVKVNYPWEVNKILFFAGIVYVLATIFKKGTTLQSENDLTI